MMENFFQIDYYQPAVLGKEESHKMAILEVSSKWTQIARLMNFEPSEIQNIVEKCGDNPTDCCIELFRRRLQTQSGRKLESLLSILKKVLDPGIFEHIFQLQAASTGQISASRGESSFLKDIQEGQEKEKAASTGQISASRGESSFLKAIQEGQEKEKAASMSQISLLMKCIQELLQKEKDSTSDTTTVTPTTSIVSTGDTTTVTPTTSIVSTSDTTTITTAPSIVSTSDTATITTTTSTSIVPTTVTSVISTTAGHEVWIQLVSNENYPATDPEWKHGKKIDGLLKDFPVIVYSIVPDSKRDKSSGQSQVDVHFPFSDYDIYEVSKCDENIKLLCIRKTKSTQFEKLFSKTLFSEKFKHLDNLETYLKEESSDVYLLFIHPVVPKVRVGPNKVPTSTLKTQECLVEFACQHILPKICTSVIVDIIESPAKTKIFDLRLEKMYHVSNELDLPGSYHPDWNEIKVAEARYEEYHGNLLLGLPVASFTIAPLGKSIYPFHGTSGQKYYRVKVPFDPIQYHIFNLNDHTPPTDQSQTHLLCVRKNDNRIDGQTIYWLLKDKKLTDDEFRSYFIEENKAAINVYFIENIPVKGETWDNVEKEEYHFGVEQISNPYGCYNNQQLLDAWIRRQTQRVIQEFVWSFIEALRIVLSQHG